jgi:hypothetical protein
MWVQVPWLLIRRQRRHKAIPSSGELLNIYLGTVHGFPVIRHLHTVYLHTVSIYSIYSFTVIFLRFIPINSTRRVVVQYASIWHPSRPCYPSVCNINLSSFVWYLGVYRICRSAISVYLEHPYIYSVRRPTGSI